jgi:hypothetical protein
MNEPSSFCLGSCGTGKRNESPQFWWNLPADEYVTLHAEWEANLNALGTGVPGDSRNLLYPPYMINNGAGNLSEKTAPTTALHYGKIPHYDLHNLYGHAESHVTNNVGIHFFISPLVRTRSLTHILYHRLFKSTALVNVSSCSVVHNSLVLERTLVTGT